MDSVAPEITPEPPVVFRGKKRKFYRQRGETNHESAPLHSEQPQPQPQSVPSTHEASASPTSESPAPDADNAKNEDTEDDGLSVAEALRRRNARRSRLKGVTFGTNNNAQGDTASDGYDDELSRMIREEENRVLDISNVGVNRRFAPQTGMVVELVNQHMTEYIESELAKKHSAMPSAQFASHGQLSSQSDSTVTTTDLTGPKQPEKSRALLGKLMEVDLGDETRSRNEAMTDRAWRKLRGEAVDEEDEAALSKRVRMGKDGKPYRPRNRRNSDDIKRDQLVEELLRENRLDVYDTPTPPSAGPSGANDEETAADDRIAEEFRREFLDAMAQRHRRRHAVAANKHIKKANAKKDEDVLRGPKLGGSRNTRAAMRDILLQKEKEKKK